MSATIRAIPVTVQPIEPLIGPIEAMLILDIKNRKTLCKRARLGHIPAIRMPNQYWKFRRSELEAWMAARHN